MSERYEKNIKKIQDMVDGNHQRKIVVGDASVTSNTTRKVGDTWTDSEGYEWEQKEGFKVKKSSLPSKGVAEECSDCKSFILTKWDKDSYKHNGRCYYCQGDFEAKLRTYPIKYWAFRRLKMLNLMDGLDEEMTEQINLMHEAQEENKRKHNDMSVANALSNANISMNIKKATN
tara:strand:+ start:99 stop:620 length:522 start_codon:yes stop_codon:yes gene_type:complete